MLDISRIKEFEIDIVVVTCDRLPYLQKCIWSIIAATEFPFRIHVIDDVSTDGTKEWLNKMKNRGLIHTVIFNKEKQGTDKNFNQVIMDHTDTPYVAICNDDMYFHRYWDYAIADIVHNQSDVGAISFFNYAKPLKDILVKMIDADIAEIKVSGLGAGILNRKAFEEAGQFRIPTGKLMGYFTTPFCSELRKLKSNNRIYATVPHYVTNMDDVDCPLKEFQHIDENGYWDFRAGQKKFFSKNRKKYKKE